MIQLRRIEKVVLDSITRTISFGMFQTWNSFERSKLNIDWQRRRKTIQIILLRGFTFGFEKKLVLLFVGKSYNFSLDARTIARTNAANLSIIKR